MGYYSSDIYPVDLSCGLKEHRAMKYTCFHITKPILNSRTLISLQTYRVLTVPIGVTASFPTQYISGLLFAKSPATETSEWQDGWCTGVMLAQFGTRHEVARIKRLPVAYVHSERMRLAVERSFAFLRTTPRDQRIHAL